MASRYEYKYLVPNTLVDKLRTELSPYMELDNFAKKQSDGQYTVRSIYYDSPQFTCYKEKIDGVQIRNKFRIRGYDECSEESLIFLEIKHKNTNCISKSRAPLYYANITPALVSRRIDDVVLSFSGNGAEKKDARKFLYYYYVKNLRPAVLVIYDREAFQGKMDPSLRLTFDKNLRSVIYPDLKHLYEEDNVKSALINHFILEVKFFGSLPNWIISLISKYGLNRRALSKYTMSLETHAEFKNQRFSRRNMIISRECCDV
ncbi:MAG: VTC domain-containing protein [Calditrichaceae bacterium]